ncbi:phospholipase C type enzyme [Mortierella claussenii]|nr:phospholipase C type enzyme [Mortierella claussenii]
MMEESRLSVLTYNCWGLNYFSKDRKARLRAIGHYLAHVELAAYDIVGLQEVWVHEDFLVIRKLVKKSLPYSKHWITGLCGSGLVVLSRYPIKTTSLRRFALNGDPGRIFHGDWFDGKSCASAVILHPSIGEIEVFNTHLHATYAPVGIPDVYLGCRLTQAWETARLIRTATALGRCVIALGDYNSAPDSLVIQLLTRYEGLTDSWTSLHPVPTSLHHHDATVPWGLSPEQGVELLGITCDTPLNSWTSHVKWINALSRDPIGERLDYIFFNCSLDIRCILARVVLKDKVAGIGGANAPPKNMSDHFAVHTIFSIKNRFQQSSRGLTTGAAMEGQLVERDLDEETAELLEHVLVALQQHLNMARTRSRRVLSILLPILTLASIYLIVAIPWLWDTEDQIRYDILAQKGNMWRVGLLEVVVMVLGLSATTFISAVCLLYGFIYGGETVSAFVNVIQEVECVLDQRR